MTEEFKPSDQILKQLVTARREEVVRLQKSQAEQLKDVETRGQARIADLKKSLPKDIAAVLTSLEKGNTKAVSATDSPAPSNWP